MSTVGFDEPTPGISDISALVRETYEAQAEVERLEEAAKAARARREAMQSELARALIDADVRSFTTSDMSTRVEERYQCRQLDDSPDEEGKRPLSERLEALAALQAAGHGDLARRVVTATLGADSEELAAELMDLLRRHPKANSIMLDCRRTVPHNTLAKHAREQVREGYDPDLALLGVSIVNIAKVKKID
jgi:hypothetical protein